MTRLLRCICVFQCSSTAPPLTLATASVSILRALRSAYANLGCMTQQQTPLPGDFGLTSINGEVGRLIRIGQFLNGDGFSVYEHAFLYLGGGEIIEAEPGGARIRSVTEYAPSTVRWSTGHFQLSGSQRTQIIRRARVFEGTPYSAADYFALATHRLHIPAPGLKSFIESSGHVICSQLVDISYQAGPYELFTNRRWPGDVTPGDLNKLLDGKQ